MSASLIFLSLTLTSSYATNFQENQLHQPRAFFDGAKHNLLNTYPLRVKKNKPANQIFNINGKTNLTKTPRRLENLNNIGHVAKKITFKILGISFLFLAFALGFGASADTSMSASVALKVGGVFALFVFLGIFFLKKSKD